MELMQLKIFLAVAEERSIRKASERVFRTQPALTIALKKLEEEVGVSLFTHPRRKGWSLTEAGRLLYDYASRMIHTRDEIVALLNGQPQYSRGRLSIGTYPAENLAPLSKLALAFCRKYPTTNLQMICDFEENLLAAVRDGRIDLAFLSAAPACPMAGVDLETSAVCRSRRFPTLWMVRRRDGQSPWA